MKRFTKAILGLSFAVMLGTTPACSAFGQGGDFATVNGQGVSVKEYNRSLEQAKKQYATRFQVDFNSEQGKQMLGSIQRSIVNQLVDQKMLMIEADKRGFKASDTEIDLKLAEVKKQFPDDAAFQKAIADYGLTPADLKDQISKGVAIEKLQKDVTKDLNVTDAQVSDFYARNKAQFKHGDEVRASHILIKFDEAAKDKAKDEARALAKIHELQAKLKAGSDFAELAKQNSDDPGSKVQGGDLGFFGKGQMVPEFEKSAFSLKDGQISEPIKTTYGYHLIKRVEAHSARVESLQEVSGKIREQLISQDRNQAFQAYVTKLRQGAKIDIKPAYQPKDEPAPGPFGAPATPSK